MRKTIKFFFTRMYTIVSIVLFTLSYGAIQAYAVYYPTDNITNPTCAPGDSGCYVSLLPDQTGNAGKLLITNGTNPSWSSSLSRDLTVNGVTVGAGAGNISTNSVLGYQALTSNTSGAYNVAIGDNSLDANTIGISNIGLGHNALGANISGGYNIAAGWNTLAANTIGNYNIAFGSDAMGLNTEGIQNIAMGQQALVNNLSGQYNISLGTQSLFNNTTGGNNLAYGYYAGYNSQTGSNNIFIGAQTGLGITTGSNNTIIGANVSGLSSSLSNNIIIADGAGNQRINVDSNGNTDINGNLYSSGVKWSTTALTINKPWDGLAYGNGLFVAIASGSTGTDNIMTSPDGINWTQRTHPISRLKSIIYANGLFIASGFTNGRILTSPDGITWTLSSSASGQIYEVAYGNGLFVGVKIDNTLNRVTTSPDGITWTNRTTDVSMDKNWVGVTYGNGLFVAVASSGTGTQSIMTSPDGINWTLRTHPSVGDLQRVAYGDGRFVAVGNGGNVLTSPDGINWTLQSFPNTALLYRVIYADGMFVTAGAFSTTNNNVYTSVDGVTWKTRTVANNDWSGIAYGNGRFVMLAYSGTLGSRVAYSGKMSRLDTLTGNIFHGNHFFTGNVGIGTTSPLGKLDIAGSSSSTDLVAFDTNRSISVINTNTTTNNAQGIALRSYGTDGTTIQSGVKLLAVNTARTATTITSDFAILTNNAGTVSEKMRVLANGNIGIGSTNPTAKLQIKGTGDSSVWITTEDFNSVTNTGSVVRMGTTSSTGNRAGTIDVLNSGISSYGNLLLGRLGGNVGVGTNSTPLYKLHVGDGTTAGIMARFQNSTGTCDINPTTTSLSCSSDINLKKNITTLKDNQPFVLNSQTPDTSVLKNLNKLTSVIYNWTTEQDIDTKHPGFIAQDVEQIFPNLVSTDPNTNLKSLNYIGLIPYAIEGIKELDIKINQLSSLDAEINGSFGYLAKEFFNTVNTYIKELTVGKLKVDGDVCVDDVCISKEQFKQILIDQQNKTGQVNNIVPENNPEIIPENQNNEQEPLPDNQEISEPPIE